MSDYGWIYYFAAFPIMFVIHDTYFYWTHRIMHHKSVFNVMHLVHHKSTNPSPWAAYAFHPLEAIVEVGILWCFYLQSQYTDLIYLSFSYYPLYIIYMVI